MWSAIYSAFGEAQVDPASTITNNLRFPGQYFDVESGLHNNFHRYYDSAGGKYTQVDPIGFSGRDFNLYRYVQNNVIKYFDFLGLLQDWAPLPEGAGSATSTVKFLTGNPILEKPKHINVSVGFGGAGNLAPIGKTADSGIAFDTHGTMCFYTTNCVFVGWNSLSAGQLGMFSALGTGKICSGTYKYRGGYYYGGAGVTGEANVLYGGGSLQTSRFILGVSSPGAGTGYIECETFYFGCINESKNCGCGK